MAHPPRLCVPSSLLSSGFQGFLPAGNRLHRGTGYSSPPSAKIGYIWSYNSILLCVAAWWLIKHSDGFVVLRYEKGLEFETSSVSETVGAGTSLYGVTPH